MKKSTFKIAFSLSLIFFIMVAITVIAGIITLLANPEVIGEFFGRIVNGFNGA